MEVRDSSQATGGPTKCSVEVRYVVTVGADLCGRVQPLATTIVKDNIVRPIDRVRPTPLLELDDHERRLGRSWVQPAQDRIYPPTAQWKAVLEQHLDLFQSRVVQVVRERSQTAFPR
ncbi:hypothetical protein NOK12_13550 [Nocardioides sp. OK12]|nr:hypothetical protein NOK12_13550 [Nocardioides sp. OK12]